MHDVIVVGAGHNGLTCAAYLAKAGKRVLVLEARDVVGGLAWTMEMPNAPGYKVNPCSVEFILTGVEPSVDTELELERKHGLRWVYPETMLTWLGPDGQVMPIWRDRQKLVDEIKRYSVKDARRYEQLCDEITATLMAILPYMQGHPWRVRPQALGEMLVNAVKGRRHLQRGARALTSSIEAVCEEYFDRDEIKVPVATYSLASFAPAWEQGTGLHLALICGIHKWGVRHPVGGTGGFTQALARCVRAHGGEILTSAMVREINTHSGHARGVTLHDGREFKAGQVVAAVDPTTLLTKLLDPGVVPVDALDEIRGVQNLHTNIYTFKVDAALDRRLRFPRHGAGRPDEALSAITVCPDMGYLHRSAHNAVNGEFTHEIPIQHITSSIYDRTLVPEGSDADTLYFYAFNTPVELSGGRSWADEKQRYVELMLDNFEQYAPDVRDAIIDIDVTSPPEFETRYHVARGNYEHVDCSLAQMGPLRPTPSLAGWRTPITGLWHTGAGAFPMAFLSGWPGRGSAREVIRSQGPSVRQRLFPRMRPWNGLGSADENGTSADRAVGGWTPEVSGTPSRGQATSVPAPHR
jgi:beta-carotene ketolase (CrtO type)